MTLKIEVTDQTELVGKNGEYEKQVGYAFLVGSKYPRKVTFFGPKKGQKYPPGFYTLAPESFDVGQYDRLEVSRMVLMPIKA